MLCDLIIIVLVLASIGIGIKKGLTNSIVGAVSTIIAIIITLLLFNPLATFLMNNTKLGDKINNTVYESVTKSVDFHEGDVIVTSNVPEFIKKSLDNSVNDLKQNAVTTFAGLSKKITYNILQILSVIVIYIVTMIILFILSKVLNIITSLPIISSIDKLGGAILGFIKSVFLIYMIVTFIYVLSPKFYSRNMKESKITALILKNNFIERSIVKK